MIYVREHHAELLPLWREQQLRDLRLVHVDFHDDLRGLLIDRRRGRAYAIGPLARSTAPPDDGNFLAHAVLERRVRQLRWIHGRPGGRAWDAGIVRYESDWFAWPQRMRHRLSGTGEVPLAFAEELLDDFTGLEPGERLSVDWDCFASVLLPAQEIALCVARFLERLGPHVPPDTYAVYSPEYCHPTLPEFLRFADALAARFAQPLDVLDPELALGRLHPRGVSTGLPRSPWMRSILFLRRHGIY